MMQKLDLGCGTRKRDGYIGIDINPNSKADVIHDLNIFPYPFNTSCFDEVYADNVIEHLSDVMSVMEELHRIIKPGGQLIIKVPYFRSRYAGTDPTHRHSFAVESFSYFDPAHPHFSLYKYTPCRFKTTKIVFDEGLPHNGCISIAVRHFCNKYPMFYEHHVSHLFPLSELTFYLEVIKEM